MTTTPSERQDNNERHFPATPTVLSAREAFERGYVPISIRDGAKRPSLPGWTHTRWADAEEVASHFAGYARDGASGIGLLLGEPSGGLVDVDLDHPKALRLRDHFLPPTAMVTGRVGRARSHYWYRVTPQAGKPFPSSRPYKLPDRTMLVELRSTGGQTVIPPSVHPSGEAYRWEGKPWGGGLEEGPARVPAQLLTTQVTLLAMGAVLLDRWPPRGSRHDAYLALAGGLLRYGYEGVHPWWERNLPTVIEAMADVTNDEDSGEERVAEVMGTTIGRLREGGKAVGWPRLAELIGTDHAELVRRLARDVEGMAGFVANPPMQRLDSGVASVGADYPPGDATRAQESPAAPSRGEDTREHPAADWRAQDALVSALPPDERNPMEERVSTWGHVDLEPYLAGQIELPTPNVLRRTDGQGLFYPGRVNSLFGKSESGKSWVAMFAIAQRIAKDERVVYVDLEDEPMGALTRLRALGVGDDDIKAQFRYVHPEEPLADLERSPFGEVRHSPLGLSSLGAWSALLEAFDPTLIIVDGMTSLYGLHGLNTNDASSTDVITTWLKRLCRSGRSTVVVIDHTGKEGGPGSSPLGAHHKIAMVQGCALRVDVVTRPMPGAVGEMQLIVYKDRLGVIRAASSTSDSDPVAGVVAIDSTRPGVTQMSIAAPVAGDVVIGATVATEARLANLAQLGDIEDRIVAMFDGDLDRQVTTRETMEALHEPRPLVYKAWASLEKTGVVEQHGGTRGRYYRLRNPNRP